MIPARKLLLLCIVLLSCNANLRTPRSAPDLKALANNPELVNIGGYPGVVIDLRYSTTNNFTGKDLYGGFDQCFLHKIAAAKLEKAWGLLRKRKPGWKFLIFDGLRPRSVQWMLWDVVEGTDEESYVADPKRGSIHNYGFAIDMSLVDEKGKEVDMGTPYDSFTKLAQPRHEQENLENGDLTREQVNNRLILRYVMTNAGFNYISNEWWHFDGTTREELSKYKIIE